MLNSNRKPVALPREISEATMLCWISTGAIHETAAGSENLYFQDQFGNEFFCKCYPNRSVRTYPVIS